MQVLVKSWPNRQEASLVCLANGERKGRQRQGRQQKEIKFQSSCRKKEAWPFCSVGVQTPSVSEHQAFRPELVLLELKEKLCFCWEPKEPLRFHLWQLFPGENVNIFLSSPGKFGLYFNSTDCFRAAARLREAKSRGCVPLLCHRHWNLPQSTQSPSSLISTLSSRVSWGGHSAYTQQPLIQRTTSRNSISTGEQKTERHPFCSGKCFSNILGWS